MRERGSDITRTSRSLWTRKSLWTDKEVVAALEMPANDYLEKIVYETNQTLDALDIARKVELSVPFTSEIRGIASKYVPNVEVIGYALEHEDDFPEFAYILRKDKIGGAKPTEETKKRFSWKRQVDEPEPEEYKVKGSLEVDNSVSSSSLHSFEMRYQVVPANGDRFVIPKRYEQAKGGLRIDFKDGSIDKVEQRFMVIGEQNEFVSEDSKNSITNRFLQQFSQGEDYAVANMTWSDLQTLPKLDIRVRKENNGLWQNNGVRLHTHRGEYTFDPYERMFEPKREENVYEDDGIDYIKIGVEPLAYQAPSMHPDVFLGMLDELLNRIPRC